MGVLAALSGAVAVSCAAVLGFHDPVEDTADASAGGSGDDGGAGEGASDGASDGPSLPDRNVADCGAVPRVLVDGGLFVAPGGADTSACTIDRPCATLGAALAAASREGAPRTIYLAEGTYTGAVDLVPGVRVEGGWVVDGGWSPVCDSRLAVLEGAGESYTVRALDAGTVALAVLSVLSKPVAGAGETLYGVWAEGVTTLTLDGVAVSAGPGGDGTSAPATTGQGTNGANCDLDSGPPARNGQPGAEGEAGVGTFGPNGYDPGTGGAGEPGGSGTPGPGGPGQCIQCGTCQGLLGACTLVDAGQSCGQPGTPACGAGGGPGGAGAEGGGSSVAVYAWGARVIATNAILVAANGGKGGSGATGGSPGLTTSGTTGQAGLLCTVACSGGVVSCSGSQQSAGQGGAPGTQAGNGAVGGTGGGGQGGWSIGVYSGGGGIATVEPATITVGQPGAGGGPNGATGQAKKLAP